MDKKCERYEFFLHEIDIYLSFERHVTSAESSTKFGETIINFSLSCAQKLTREHAR